MALTLRRALPGEAQALTALAHAAKRSWGYPEAWIVAWRAALSFTPQTIAAQPVYVALADGELAGVVAFEVRAAQAGLEHLWVDPARAGRGIGRALFEHACREAAALGARELRIESDPYAEPFYRRLGAERIGEVPANVGETARSLPLMRVALARAGGR